MSIYDQMGTKKTPQSEPIPGSNQVKNNAGGYVFTVDPWQQFLRFLILGSEGGTYYVSERKLTKDNMEHLMRIIEVDGIKAVRLIIEVSDQGRALKNDPAIFALAVASVAKDKSTRQAAYAALDKVCRIPTHLFHFMTYRKNFGGISAGLRRAVRDWLNRWDEAKLAYEFAKYQSRDGWSNADILRLIHPKPRSAAQNLVFKWAVDGYDEMMKKAAEFKETENKALDILHAMNAAKTATKADLITLIEKFNLSHEMIPTEMKKEADVWWALLQKMPPTALIRNLGNLSKVGLLKPLSEASTLVVSKLGDRDSLKKGRVHPMTILNALKIYDQGRGFRGDGTWTPVPAVVDALDDAFYTAFDLIEPTNKRFLLGIDVSASMSSPISGGIITCAQAAAVMAMVIMRTEKNSYAMGFDQGIRDLGITAKMRLTEAFKRVDAINGGGTDCSLPMIWAEREKVDADVFVVLTDNETWAGRIHPKQALASYRKSRGIASKQAVCGMVATPFTIADPNDPLTLDVVGFDTATPQALSEFVRL